VREAHHMCPEKALAQMLSQDRDAAGHAARN